MAMILCSICSVRAEKSARTVSHGSGAGTISSNGMRVRRTPDPQPLERERSAGVVVLGEARWVRWSWVGLQTLIALIIFVGLIVGLDFSVMATDGAQPDLAALTTALQQMLQEQQQ